MRFWRLLVSVTIAALACSPALSAVPDPTAVEPTVPEPTTTPHVIDGTEILDPESPPPWLEEIFAELPERPEPDPLHLDLHLDPEHRTSQQVGERGGTLRLEGPAGVTYTLEIPAGALLSDEMITMTRIASVEGVEADGQVLVAVDLKPEGLVLLQPASLRFELPREGGAESPIGFRAQGNGDEAHEVVTVEVAGTLEFAVAHFSSWGYTGANSPADDKYLAALIASHEPTELAELSEKLLSGAYAEAQATGDWDTLLLAVTAIKRNGFWRAADGVYWSLQDALLRTVDHETNLISEPVYFERALKDYSLWWRMHFKSLPEFYEVYDAPFPFNREVRLANRLLTQTLMEGLEADCDRAIDALYKLRFYRIARAMQAGADVSGRGTKFAPFSGTEFPGFTEAYARQRVQECGRFTVSLETGITLVPAESSTLIIEELSSEDMALQFLLPVEASVLELDLPAAYRHSSLDCQAVDGSILVNDLRWSLNIFGRAARESGEQPLIVLLEVPVAPFVQCEVVPYPLAWTLHRLAPCPLRFELQVSSEVQDEYFGPPQKFRCSFTNRDGSTGEVVDYLTIEHDPDVGLFR